MSYEKATPQLPETTASPAQITMREEAREFNPYAAAKAQSRAEAIRQRLSGGGDQKRPNEATSPVNAQAAAAPLQAGEEQRQSETSGAITPDATGEEKKLALSPQLAALARREQKIRQQELETKRLRETLEKEKAEIADLKAMKAKLEAGDFSAIESRVPYDKYTQYLIEKESGTSPEQKALKEVNERISAIEKGHKDDLDKRFEAAVSDRRRSVKELVTGKPEDFSSIKELGAEEAVVQHILQTWEHDGEDLSPEQAAKEVEEILLERAQRWAGLSKLKKVAKAVAGTDTSEQVLGAREQVAEDSSTLPRLKDQQQQHQQDPQNPASRVRTLTNNMSPLSQDQESMSLKRSLKPLHLMSEAERYQEARRRAEEKLKKGIRQ